jgi:hypothetical protein
MRTGDDLPVPSTRYPTRTGMRRNRDGHRVAVRGRETRCRQEALSTQDIPQPTGPCIGAIQTQALHHEHQHQFGHRDRSRLLVRSQSGKKPQFRRVDDQKSWRRGNQRLSLSNFALVSVLRKKPFSRVSCTNQVSRRIRSEGWSSGGLPETNPASAPYGGSAFHRANCKAWKSNLVAKSACGWSPRMADGTTFALKAAEWLRQSLPAPRHLRPVEPGAATLFIPASKSAGHF